MNWVLIYSLSRPTDDLNSYNEVPLDLPENSLVKILVKYPKWRKVGSIFRYSLTADKVEKISFRSLLYFNQPLILETSNRPRRLSTKLEVVPWLPRLNLEVYQLQVETSSSQLSSIE